MYGRVWHFPWPDHHPPPFALIPNIMASMRNWLQGADGKETDVAQDIEDKVKHIDLDKVKADVRDKLGKESTKGKRVVVVHCKAGKGRSGTIATSYLISQEGWKSEDALKRFTERRMRPGFGAGVSIPSQLRWVGYVVRWTAGGKKYVERQMEVCEVHVWGLRDGVKISIEGYVDEGRTIKVFHVFKREEREIVRGEISNSGFADIVSEVMGRTKSNKTASGDTTGASKTISNDSTAAQKVTSQESTSSAKSDIQPAGADVIYRPSSRVILPSSDINIDFERRNKAVSNFTMVTSVSHVWFNTFFEGNGPEQEGHPDASGVFEIDWEKLDGIKGSSRKGTKGFDRVAVVWKAVDSVPETIIKQPEVGEPVTMPAAADWTGEGVSGPPDEAKELGLRVKSPVSEGVSRASSVRSSKEKDLNLDEAVKSAKDDMNGLAGVQSHVPGDSEHAPTTAPSDPPPKTQAASEPVPQADGTSDSQEATSDANEVRSPEALPTDVENSSTGISESKSESELKDAREHRLGHLGHHTKAL